MKENRGSKMRLYGFGRGFTVLVRSALLLAVAGGMQSCGGGGGGGSPKLVYETDWSNRSRGGVTGLSQRIQLFDSQNRLLTSIIVNQNVNGLQSATIGVQASGTYRLHGELYSLRDLAGTQTGEFDTFLQIGSGTRFRTSVGLEATSVVVTPQSATIRVQHSKQFYATGYAGPGNAVFSPLDGFSWTTLGGTASVSESGIVLGLSPGSGTVRATHDATAIQGSAVFTVEPFQTTTSKWTIMIFLNAANDLYPFSTLNMNQMERVAQNADVRFVVQWKQSLAAWPGPPAPLPSFVGTRRYLVKPDLTNSIASEIIQDMGEGVDMGIPSTLNSFIAWAKTYYPAQRYVLVVWNHGNGWRRAVDPPTRAVSYDDETGNAIQIWQLNQAIGDIVLDILAWDASLMQMIEVAYEAQDRARYIAGSEESPPGEGYPYHLIFDDFRDRPDDTTLALSKAFVDGMLEGYAGQSRKITQSVLDTAMLPALGSAASALAVELIANVDTIGPQIPSIRAQAQAYSDSSVRRYRDLDHLCQLMAAQISVPSVQTAANAVRAAVANAVVWEGHNNQSPNSRGISIDFSSSSQFAGAALDYALLRFAADTQWNEWLTIAP